MQVYPHTHMNTFTCTCTHILFSHTYMHTHCHMHTHKHTHTLQTQAPTYPPNRSLLSLCWLMLTTTSLCPAHNTAQQYMTTCPTAHINWCRDIHTIIQYINPHGEYHNQQPSLVKSTQQLQLVCMVIVLFLGHPALHALINGGQAGNEASTVCTKVLLLQSGCLS